MKTEFIVQKLERAKKVAKQDKDLGFSKEYWEGFVTGLNYALKLIREEVE